MGNGSVDFGVHQSVKVLHTLDSAGFWDESALSGVKIFGESVSFGVELFELVFPQKFFTVGSDSGFLSSVWDAVVACCGEMPV